MPCYCRIVLISLRVLFSMVHLWESSFGGLAYFSPFLVWGW